MVGASDRLRRVFDIVELGRLLIILTSQRQRVTVSRPSGFRVALLESMAARCS
jgi:hypothetical protein